MEGEEEAPPPLWLPVGAALLVVALAALAARVMARLGWHWGLPVILEHHSGDLGAWPVVPETSMQRVSSVFALDIADSNTASLAGGVTLSVHCLVPCVLTCYWGCALGAVHAVLQGHARRLPTLRSPQQMEMALGGDYLHREQFAISKDEKVLQRVELPDALRGGDLGGVPRLRYPLVVLLTHAEHRPQPRAPDMVALLTCVHLPDPVHSVSCRVLHQLLLTHSGLSYDLKRLFMSTDAPEDSQSDEGVTSQVLPEVRAEGQVAAQDEEDGDGRGGACRDCVVCQNAKVNRVLLPCRHTCLCDHCVQYFRQCPMCRQMIQFSFPLNPD
ncbi:cell growth regulator with RING finger domain protein 1 isoform X1 [Petromyzon marinus]|uniref:Cell growth regulator with RING finger domain protein 1 n=3 Tax=Petromyzon marinus TaxID=7757 RepID=A0AAJ7TLM3_PETMA|nr:cell growth regulator with RING finger domain protein 1 isoform X1 [Petromyzon marinus]